jgi:undecaprenyl-diphosphatase
VLQILILAVVQGIAEFLPISSSGHLALLSALMEIKESAPLSVILHAGTLGSIVVVFWERILRLLKSDRRVVPLLVVGTVPAAVLGILIKSKFEHVLENPLLAGAMLLVTGAMLLLLGRMKEKPGEYQSMSLLGAFLVGCFQAFAILPGVSRSGSTILGGRMLGLKNEDSVTFSFLLAIPAILGATVLTLKDLWEQHSEGTPIHFSAAELIIGAGVSFFVGILALKWLVAWSRKARLHWFAWWCFPAGLIAIWFFGSKVS